MIEVEEMGNKEIADILKNNYFAHLGCARNNSPYVIPIHYAYISPYIYIYTTSGKKTAIISENPEVCLQIEEIRDTSNWKSIVINGTAAVVTDPEEREKAVNEIRRNNPTLTPAVSIRWMDEWVRENVETVYRIEPTMKSGRKSLPARPRVFVRKKAQHPEPY